MDEETIQRVATPAVCEVQLENGQACGVIAVGRCVFCGHAFCDTHRARFLQRVYTDTCAPCFPKTEEGKQRCEVDNCGVTAVDHCGICKRAICATHRIFERLPTTVFQPEIYVPRCRPCFDNSSEEAKRARQRAEAVEAREYLLSGAARKALLSSKEEPVAIYQIESQLKKGLFSSGKWVTVVTSVQRGWFLGNFDGTSWALLDVDSQPTPLVPVQPYRDGYALVERQKNRDFSAWVQTAYTIRVLTNSSS